MKNSSAFAFLVLCTLFATQQAAAKAVQEDIELADDIASGDGLILNSQAKKAIRAMQEQMPCGWPNSGIPPLAPYTNPEIQLNFTNGVVQSLIEALRFRLDGLDIMDILNLQISYTFTKKVKFDFNFPELRARALYLNTNTFADMLEQLGISVRYEGSGPLDFSLHNLRLTGEFKYKMPILWGSIKIYKFQMTVGLGSVTSNIGGILGNGAYNQLINNYIEQAIPLYVNNNQAEISAKIETTLVPSINESLKGNNILSLLWDSLMNIGSSSPPPCIPTPAPWLAEI